MSKVKYIIIISIIACIAILICKLHNKSIEAVPPSFYKINISENIANIKEINLSFIAKDIDYIPLQTLPGALLNDIYNIQICKSGIYICDGEMVSKFSISGKFIKHIGGIGNGPGEYSGVRLLAVNEETNTVLVGSENKGVLRYDMDGNFLEKYSDLPYITNLVFCCGKTYFHTSAFSKNQSGYNLIIADTKLNEMQRFRRIKDNAGTFFISVGLYCFNNEVLCKGAFNDTIYQIGNEDLKPHAIIELGKNQLPSDFSINDILSNNTEVIDKYYIHKNFIETQLFLFAELSTFRVIDKKRQNRYLFYNKVEDTHYILPQTGFVNDFDNGLPFVPKYLDYDNICVDYADAYKLIEWVNSESFKNSTPKYPEKKKRLQQLADSLTINDNTVLMLVKLKE